MGSILHSGENCLGELLGSEMEHKITLRFNLNTLYAAVREHMNIYIYMEKLCLLLHDPKIWLFIVTR